MAKTVHEGLKIPSLKENAEIFRGVPRLDGNNISNQIPYITGRGIFLWTQMPKFMEAVFPEATRIFRNYMEKGFISFDGINDLNANFEEVNGGNASAKYDVMSATTDDFRNFTLKVNEQTGRPITTYIETWMTGIFDPMTDSCHYHGALESKQHSAIITEVSPKFHTAEGIYMTFDPSYGSNGIEYAAFITNIKPTKAPKSFLNTSKGDNSVVQLDLEFSGYKYEGPDINEKAKQLWAEINFIKNYLETTYPSLPTTRK